MAISEDTAALVAAQLTTAWAMRIGVGKPDPARTFDVQIIDQYNRFRDMVREVDITHSRPAES